jgi:hypothetical protein
VKFIYSMLASKKILTTSALLLVPLIVNFAKISFAAYKLPLPDFGRFSLYVALSSALVYFLNSGLYEGHLKYFSLLQIEKRSRRLCCMQIRAEFVSFTILMIAIIITLIGLQAIESSESNFILAMVFASHVQAHSNLITAHARVSNNLLRVGAILSARSLLSALLFIGLIMRGDIEVANAYLYENIAITLLFSMYLSLRIKFRHMGNAFNQVSVMKHGVWQCYASSLRYFYLALERFAASLLLSPVAMGEYGRLMLVYQVMVVGGGVISQLVQQKILINALSRGVRATGIQLLRYQGVIVSVTIVIASVIFFIASDFLMHFAAVFFGRDIMLWGCGAIFLAGLISGTSLIDSLALGSSNGFAYLKIQVLSGLVWSSLFWMCYGFLDPWTLNLQAFSFLALTVLLIVGNVRFVSLH